MAQFRIHVESHYPSGTRYYTRGPFGPLMAENVINRWLLNPNTHYISVLKKGNNGIYTLVCGIHAKTCNKFDITPLC